MQAPKTSLPVDDQLTALEVKVASLEGTAVWRETRPMGRSHSPLDSANSPPKSKSARAWRGLQCNRPYPPALTFAGCSHEHDIWRSI
jgi:hypothetical protein